ncbi:hypothetical protein H5410_031323 [Solanum commersonii]|uniref:Uncharacterized protein n=1 Tax=Solanum commersonii TaxID=4109 RepID=A0A9J5YI33_SOLCO|nr:hypothetical protein H5410_031323 [Solanum commersonii]
MGSLNPVNSFSSFDKGKIMTLAKCYPNDPKFSNLQGIRDLAKALIEANLAKTYSLIYLLVQLT